jgi:hypothetical protein
MTAFINAQEMHLRHPDTFDAPSYTELAAIRPGDSVKVCAGYERFWVTVTEATESALTGTVDNDLIYTNDHGLSYGDTISFPRGYAYAIMTESEA